jgi:hypothetical protein
LARLQDEPTSIDHIRREKTDGDGIEFDKAVVLNDNDWPRFPGIILRATAGPNFATLHSGQSSVGQSEIESMKAKSSFSPGLLAIAIDCRLASFANSGDRMSGTQI